MIQKITLFLLVIFISSLPRYAFAEEKSVNNILFSIQQLPQVLPDLVPGQLPVDPSAAVEKPGFIAINFEFTNKNEAKKLDLQGGIISYKLFDNFGNQYRQIGTPQGYDKPALALPKNFPSIYPGETYGETLFFESPVLKATDLKLLITAPTLGIPGAVEIGFLAKPPDPVPVIKIVGPLEGTVFKQGEAARLNVSALGGRIPKKVIVLAFSHTLEDSFPGMNNVYDINVPIDQVQGTYVVNVIAQWSVEGEDVMSSDQITVYVEDPIPLDAL